jgi:hypothetical protein
MRLFVLVSFLAALAFPAAAQAQPADWKTYAYPDLGVSAEFPAEPKRTDDSKTGAGGPIPSATILVDQSTRAYLLMTGDYSRQQGGAPTDLEAAVQRMVDGTAGKKTITEQAPFKVRGGAGREAVIVGGGLTMRFRAYYVAPLSVIVAVASAEADAAEWIKGADATRFFAGFRIAD